MTHNYMKFRYQCPKIKFFWTVAILINLFSMNVFTLQWHSCSFNKYGLQSLKYLLSGLLEKVCQPIS